MSTTSCSSTTIGTRATRSKKRNKESGIDAYRVEDEDDDDVVVVVVDDGIFSWFDSEVDVAVVAVVVVPAAVASSFVFVASLLSTALIMAVDVDMESAAASPGPTLISMLTTPSTCNLLSTIVFSSDVDTASSTTAPLGIAFVASVSFLSTVIVLLAVVDVVAFGVVDDDDDDDVARIIL